MTSDIDVDVYLFTCSGTFIETQTVRFMFSKDFHAHIGEGLI